MTRPRLRRPPAATVISLLALFIALGVSAYAAVKIPAHSVGTRQLKPNAVVSSKVKDSSLLKKDFAPGQLPAGARGATGPAGPVQSGFAANSPTPSAVITSSPAKLSLSDGTGFITVTSPSRLIANGTAILTTSDANGSVIECRLAVFPQPANSQLPIGHAAKVTLPPASDWFVTLPLTAAVDVAAGTYNVELQCYLVTGTAASASYIKGNLTVIAADG